MAPKRQAKAKDGGQSQAPPLTGCTVAVSGTFPGTSQAAIGELIATLGGTFVKSVTQECTHLVATPSELQRQTTKVKTALGYPNVQIVGFSWIQASEDDNTKAPENEHVVGSASAVPVPQTATNGNATTSTLQKANGQSKRSASPDALPNAPVKKQKTQTAIDQSPDPAKQPNTAAPAKPINVPQDEGVNSPTHRVYVGPDGIIYDASLNQTNSSNNNNKFYRIQVSTLF